MDTTEEDLDENEDDTKPSWNSKAFIYLGLSASTVTHVSCVMVGFYDIKKYNSLLYVSLIFLVLLVLFLCLLIESRERSHIRKMLHSIVGNQFMSAALAAFAEIDAEMNQQGNRGPVTKKLSMAFWKANRFDLGIPPGKTSFRDELKFLGERTLKISTAPVIRLMVLRAMEEKAFIPESETIPLFCDRSNSEVSDECVTIV